MKIFLIIGLIVALGFGAYLFKNTRTIPEDPEVASTLPQKVIIQMTEQGYMPKDITIKKDQTIVFENKSTKELWPASNIHPTHGIYPEFDPKKPVPAGESWEFTFDKVGIWRYHDHIIPEIKGVITVE